MGSNFKVLLYFFQGVPNSLQGFRRYSLLELCVNHSEVGIGDLPYLTSVICKKNVIHPKISWRRLSIDEILLLHGLYQTGQCSFGSVGDKSQVVLNQAILVVQVFQHNELFFRQVNPMLLHVIRDVVIDKLCSFTDPGQE